jgi:hypothetical protein
MNPLHNVEQVTEQERQVIGAIIKDPNVAYHECIRQGVTEKTFFDATCRQLWRRCDGLEDIKQASDLPGILHRSQEDGTSRLSGEATNMRNKLTGLAYGLNCIAEIVGHHDQRATKAQLGNFHRQYESKSKEEALEILDQLRDGITKANSSTHSKESFIGKLESMIASTPQNIETMKQRAKDAVFILPQIALSGDLTIINAAPNAGKTLITLWLLSQRDIEATKEQTILYINADDSFPGGIEKAEFMEGFNVHSLIPNQSGFDTDKLTAILREAIKTQAAGDLIIVLDTLKKFVNMMDKNFARSFNILLREFTQAGGTVIALAHTNKHKNGDGKGVAEGVGDFLNDFDCCYILDVEQTDETKTIVFENQKLRGPNVKRVSFTYDNREKRTWTERFESVARLSDDEARSMITGIKDAEIHDNDAPVINYLESILEPGPAVRRVLTQEDLGAGKPSRGQREQVLDRYTDANPRKEFQHWTARTGDKGGKIYRLPDMVGQ